MAYPAPLSEKTLKKKYAEAGLDERTVSFLQDLFEGAAHLYGAIPLGRMWDVYKELASKRETLRIHRRDMYAFAGIARRANGPYRIYDMKEIWPDDFTLDGDQFKVIALLELAGKRASHLYDLGYVLYKQSEKPYYVPENLLEIKGEVVSPEEEQCKEYLGNLRANSPVVTIGYYASEEKSPSPHQGKRLCEFSFRNDAEKAMVRFYSGEMGSAKPQEKKLAKCLAVVDAPFPEKLFKRMRHDIFVGEIPFTEVFEDLSRHLQEAGVVLTESEAMRLIRLVAEFSNHSHLYCNCGWTPRELSEVEKKGNHGPLTISFGPGIRESFKDGSLSYEEIKRQVEAWGGKVEPLH